MQGPWLGGPELAGGNLCSDASMSDAGQAEVTPGGDPQVSECTRKNVEAAKMYIENMYRSQAQSVINRKERRYDLEKRMANEGLSPEEMRSRLRELEQKESDYARLMRHKISAADFEPLAIIGRGAFGEVDLASRPAPRAWVVDVFVFVWWGKFLVLRRTS
mmetsp:Transcript_8943/g.29586  ORF Transcript_8943/g.29586 Transcript_8943/m.29586 type:complete len:161 (-) Transcript_8943:993-1475(-)